METRGAKLTVYASRTGALDYSQYRRYSRYWQIKEDLVLRDIEDEFVARLDELAHQFHCSLAQPNGMEGDEDRAAFHVQGARNAFNDVGKLLLPWYKQWEEEGQTLAKMWKEFKLKEQDPVYAAYLEKQRKKLRDSSEALKNNAKTLEALKTRLREISKQKSLTRKRGQHAGLSRR